jgi:4-amino-4-deoxy-L-arabinose transferase-like glycosyltransferase
MERAIQFGAALALFWVGQGLLGTQPMVGVALMLAAVVTFVGLPHLLARPVTSIGAGAMGGRRSAALEALNRRAPDALPLIGASAVCGVAACMVDAYPALRPWLALLTWSAAIGLLIAGAWRLTPPYPAGARPLARGLRLDRALVWELAAVLAVALLGLALRMYAIERIPWNFGGDEGEMGSYAREILAGNIRDPFATGWLSHPNLWFFLQALTLRAFGNTIFGLRMLSALIGAATVLALYVFARPLYGRRVALLAAALLATYHFHIHFSRLGVNNIVDPLAALVAFAAFLYGMRKCAPLGFALAGVTLGLAQHFYMGSRLAPLVVAAVLVHQLIFDRAKLWGLRWHLALLALGFLLGFGPLMNYFVSHPLDFTARLAMVGVFQTDWFAQQRASGLSAAKILLDQAYNGFGAWTWQPDRSAWYDPRIPLLDRASALLFLFGLGITITNWRRIDAAMLLAWLAGTAVFGGMLLVNAPESPRYVTSAPAVCLLVAFALEMLVMLLRGAGSMIAARVELRGKAAEDADAEAAAASAAHADRLNRRLGQAGWGLAGLLALLLSLWNVNFYFREYTPRNTYGWFNTEVATTIGQYLALRSDPVFVYFVGGPVMYYGNASIRFQAPDVPGIDVLDSIGSGEALPEPPDGRRPIFIFLPHRAGELAAAAASYPNGSTQQVRASNGDPLMTIYEPRS